MKQSATTYTRRENARRAGIAAGLEKPQVQITVHKDGDTVRFGWKERAAPISKPMTAGNSQAPTPQTMKGERNGVKRPKPGGACAAVWEWLDKHSHATLNDAKAAGEKRGWNLNNVACEFYRHRKYFGPGNAAVAQRP